MVLTNLLIMDSMQVENAVNNINNMKIYFKGVFYNKNIDFNILDCHECFFIVNTITDITVFGHWVSFFIRNQHCYFFDSFGFSPNHYGSDIEKFYSDFRGYKTVVFNKPIQSSFSYVCGAYAIVNSYYMYKGYSIRQICNLFSKNKKKNDAFIVNQLYRLVGLRLSCVPKFCTLSMFGISCKFFCNCNHE